MDIIFNKIIIYGYIWNVKKASHQNLYFWSKCIFFTKSFYFRPKFIFFTKISIFHQKFNVCPKILKITFLRKIPATYFNFFGQGGDLRMPPMILRRNAVSIIRPLTAVEAICVGLPMALSGLNIGHAAARFLTDVLPVFNKIIFPSGIMEAFSDQLRAGVKPFEIGRDLQLSSKNGVSRIR